MNRLLASAALVAMVAMSGNAFAAGEVTATGTVAQGCTGTLADTGLPLTDFVASVANGNTTGWTTSNLGNVSCSTAASVGASSGNGGLKRVGSTGACGTSTDADCVMYQGKASWTATGAGDAIYDTTSATSATGGATAGAAAGKVKLNVSLPGTYTGPLTAGDFQDVITVTVATP